MLLHTEIKRDVKGAIVNGWFTKGMEALKTVGFPIVVALLLLLAMFGVFPSPITKIAVGLDKHINDVKSIENILEGHTRLLREICRNTARSEAGRLGCDR